MIDFIPLVCSAIVLANLCVTAYLLFRVGHLSNEITFLKVRSGKLRLDLDETIEILSKSVQVLSEASTETMKAVMDLRAGK